MNQHAAIEKQFLLYLATKKPKHLATVFEDMRPELLGAGRRAGLSQQGAEDAVQETFLAVIEGERRFEPGRPFVPWVRGIALRQIRSERRRHARVQMIFRAGEEDALPGSEDPCAFVSSDTRRQIKKAVRTLSDGNREVVNAALFDGLSNDEISVKLGLSKSAVAVRLHRGLSQVRERLGSRANFGALAFLSLKGGRKAAARAAGAIIAAGIMGAVLVPRLLRQGEAPPKDSTVMADLDQGSTESQEVLPTESASTEQPEADAPLVVEEVAMAVTELPEPSVEPVGTWSGTVVLRDGSEGPEGVEIFVLATTPGLVLPTGPVEIVATTVEGGLFTIPRREFSDDATPLLMARLGDEIGWADINEPVDEEHPIPVIRMVPEFAVYATVVDANGLPIEGASVAAFTHVQRFMEPLGPVTKRYGFIPVQPYRHLNGATTDAQGKATIGGLVGRDTPGIGASISAWKPGYATAMQAMLSKSGISLSPTLTLIPLGELSLSGSVVDGNGTAVEGVDVSFRVRGEAAVSGQPFMSTGPDGSWHVPPAQLNEYPMTIGFELAGFVDGTLTLNQPHEIEPEAYTVVIPKAAPLVGTVRGPDGQPVQGADVTVATAGATKRLQTDDDGMFRCESLREGARRITVRHAKDGGAPTSVCVDVPKGETEATITLPQQQQGLKTLVIAAAGEAPWKRVDLQAKDVRGVVGSLDETRVEAGAAFYGDVAAGTWVFGGINGNGDRFIKEITIPADSAREDARYELEPVETGGIDCLISRPDGTSDLPDGLGQCLVVLRRTDLPPLPGWFREGRNTGWTELYTQQIGENRMELRLLTPGPWSLTVVGKGWATEPVAIDVEADEISRLDLVAMVAGQVDLAHPVIASSGLARFAVRKSALDPWHTIALLPFAMAPEWASHFEGPVGTWQWRARIQAQTKNSDFFDLYPPTYGVVTIEAGVPAKLDLAGAAIVPPE